LPLLSPVRIRGTYVVRILKKGKLTAGLDFSQLLKEVLDQSLSLSWLGIEFHHPKAPLKGRVRLKVKKKHETNDSKDQPPEHSRRKSRERSYAHIKKRVGKQQT
jgi:hypothetical protein